MVYMLMTMQLVFCIMKYSSALQCATSWWVISYCGAQCNGICIYDDVDQLLHRGKTYRIVV